MKYRVSLIVTVFLYLIVPTYSYVVLNHVKSENFSYDISAKDFEEPRYKKHKFHLLSPLLLTALLIKSIIFPLILKAMAVMTSIAVILSFKSLIVSSLIGYARYADGAVAPKVKVVYVDKKPWPKKSWTPPEEYIVPPIFRSKFSYVPHDDAFFLNDDEPKVIDHYHSFVDK